LASSGATATVLLVFYRLPLPWYRGTDFDLPTLYNVGLLASVLSGTIFLALYAWRLAKEARQMADALAATEMVLAREQQLHALDGLAAAAAHELGTPLSTIAVVAKELNKDAPKGSQLAEDLALLQTQAARCREILKKLTRGPTEPDPLHARMSITQLIEEAAGPYRGFGAELVMTARPSPGARAERGKSRSANAGQVCSTVWATLSRTPSTLPASASKSAPGGPLGTWQSRSPTTAPEYPRTSWMPWVSHTSPPARRVRAVR
jgi:hypothetical protein